MATEAYFAANWRRLGWDDYTHHFESGHHTAYVGWWNVYGWLGTGQSDGEIGHTGPWRGTYRVNYDFAIDAGADMIATANLIINDLNNAMTDFGSASRACQPTNYTVTLLTAKKSLCTDHREDYRLDSRQWLIAAFNNVYGILSPPFESNASNGCSWVSLCPDNIPPVSGQMSETQVDSMTTLNAAINGPGAWQAQHDDDWEILTGTLTAAVQLVIDEVDAYGCYDESEISDVISSMTDLNCECDLMLEEEYMCDEYYTAWGEAQAVIETQLGIMETLYAAVVAAIAAMEAIEPSYIYTNLDDPDMEMPNVDAVLDAKDAIKAQIANGNCDTAMETAQDAFDEAEGFECEEEE